MSRVIAHGVDFVEIARLAEMIQQHEDRFLERCFTPEERAYAENRKRRDEHLAARFAAKEAVLKALGTGWRSGIAWTDVEVVLEPSGAPRIVLSGVAAETASKMGIAEMLVSLSHAGGFAMASVIAVG